MVLLLKTQIFLLIIIFGSVENSKILAMFPMCTYSHYLTGFAIAKELAMRGHEVTFVSCYPLKEPIKNFRDIYIEGMKQAMHNIQRNFYDMQNHPVIRTTTSTRNSGLIMVEKTLSHPPFQAILHSNETFDLIINEDYATQGLLGVAAHFNAKSMLVSSWRTNIFSNFYFGNPEEPAYVPLIFSQTSPPLSFFERCKNLFHVVTEYFVREFVTIPTQDELLHKYLPHVPKLRDLLYNQSLMLVNSHISFDLPVPLLPNIIEIGGYHVQEPKPLPNDLKKIMDKAVEGVIFFSLGSNIKSSDMKTEKMQLIMNVFAEMKQTVLWKCDNANISNKPRNVIVGNWFPQNDILAHPNVKVFITQGGMMSIIEAVYHGIPILGFPFFADQHSNIKRLSQRGHAIGLSSIHFSADEFSWAVKELIDNPKYKENAKERSKLLRDRPMKPLDTAVYWVEYIIRNGGSHFKSTAIDLFWYEKTMLDVLVFYLAVAWGFLYLLMVVLKRIFCTTRKHNTVKKTQ